MAIITKVRLEASGADPGEIKKLLDDAIEAIDKHAQASNGQIGGARITDEVYERIDNKEASGDWYKARRVAWLVQPNGPNDPDSGVAVTPTVFPTGTAGSGGISYSLTNTSV